MKIIISIFSLLLISCNSKEYESNNNELKEEIKNLKNKVVNLKNEIKTLKLKNATLKVTQLEYLYLFEPSNLKISLYNKRPQKNNETFLVIPAAFTDPNNKIDGLYIVNGALINSIINERLNGVCIIYKNKLKICNRNDIIINEEITNKQNLFQQVLLLFDFKIIECTLFKNNLNLRRALVEINNHFYLVESKKRMTILNFQKSLYSINVKNAIYLDMVTYSEGWYRNDNKIFTIGETMTQTKRQSNWLVFESL